jgi:hypothetical protein
MILAIVMVFSAIPMTASANAIPSTTKNVETLITVDSISNLLDYLVTNINNLKDELVPTVLRIVFLAMNDEKVNGYVDTIGKGKDVSLLNGTEASKVLVTWLDTDILPPLQEKLNDSGAIATINDNVPGLTVKVGSVQDVFDTLAQLDKTAIKAILATGVLGDAKDIDVSSVKNVTVAGNEFGAVKALIQFVKDNMSTVKKALKADISLGVVDNFFDINETIGFIGDLPKLLKSYIYKLIDSDAAAGEFAEGKMGGDWEKSAYGSYTADQLLAAALIKTINGTDDIVSKDAANTVLTKSFYEILADYAKPVYAKFAVEPLNSAIASLNEWLAEQTNATLKAQFKSTIAPVTADTFNSVFANVKDTGILGQLNNICLIALKQMLTDSTYKALDLTAGGNDKLNGNLTKFARYVLKLAQKDSDFAEMLYVPADILSQNADSLELSDMAYIILKPFFTKWFDNADAATVAAADSLPDLAVLAVYYAATNDWINLDYTFTPVTKATLDGLKNDPDKANDEVLKTAAGIAIGALRYNKDSIHFTADASASDWNTAFDSIANWGLDFINGLPAVARVHNLKNQNGYGGFYKLNVVLNELINFAFLNDVNSVPFKLDLEVLLKEGVLKNLYEFDVAGIIGIFGKNAKTGNVLNGQLIPSVISIVDRIVTALFEHTGKQTSGDSDPVPAAGAKQCTHTVSTHYEYCANCGAYYKAPVVNETKLARPTHNYVKVSETKKSVTPTKATCNFQTVTVTQCTKCGDKQTKTTNGGHTAAVKEENGYKITYCTVCKTEIKREPIGGNTDPVTPPVEDKFMMGDVDGDEKISAADARLALRASVKLEKFWNQPDDRQFKASDTDGDKKISAGDARKILRVSVKLDKFD